MSPSDERPKATQATPGHRKIRCIRPKKPETTDFARKTRAQYGFFSSLLEHAMIDAFKETFPGAPTRDVTKLKFGKTWGMD